MRCGADDRQALEQLCRYITRPALANERVQTNAAGQVVLKLKIAWRDGTTHLVMSPLDFMQRLAALVPRPRLHRIRFHGVLAPNAKLRAQVVPQEPEVPAQEAKPAECETNSAHHRPVRLSWGRLLKRVFEIDMEHYPNCGGELKIIAAFLEQPVIEKILMHLGLHARACSSVSTRWPHTSTAMPSPLRRRKHPRSSSFRPARHAQLMAPTDRGMASTRLARQSDAAADADADAGPHRLRRHLCAQARSARAAGAQGRPATWHTGDAGG